MTGCPCAANGCGACATLIGATSWVVMIGDQGEPAIVEIVEDVVRPAGWTNEGPRRQGPPERLR